MKQLGSILALAAAVAATHIASAQPFDPVAHDIRSGVYRGHAVTYEVIDGLAIGVGGPRRPASGRGFDLVAFSIAARRSPVWDRAFLIALVKPSAHPIRIAAGDVPFMT